VDTFSSIIHHRAQIAPFSHPSPFTTNDKKTLHPETLTPLITGRPRLSRLLLPLAISTIASLRRRDPATARGGPLRSTRRGFTARAGTGGTVSARGTVGSSSGPSLSGPSLSGRRRGRRNLWSGSSRGGRFLAGDGAGRKVEATTLASGSSSGFLVGGDGARSRGRTRLGRRSTTGGSLGSLTITPRGATSSDGGSGTPAAFVGGGGLGGGGGGTRGETLGTAGSLTLLGFEFPLALLGGNLVGNPIGG
jgi:hypothetical protein